MKKITAGFLLNAPADSGRGARRAMCHQPFPWGTLAALIPSCLAEKAMRRLPDFLLDYGKLPKIVVPDGTEIEIRILAVPFTSRALIDHRHRYHKLANDRLLKAPQLLAQRRPHSNPIAVLGLGAATAIALGHGREIHRRYRYRGGNYPIVTNGNTITAGLAVSIAQEAIENKQVYSVGVFGPTGSVGTRTFELAIETFAPKMAVLYFNPSSAGNPDRELKQRSEQYPNVQFSCGSIRETVSCQLVFMASSSTIPFYIEPSWPNNGAVIIDIGKPLNTFPELQKLRPDIRIIDGSLAKLPDEVDWRAPCQRMGLRSNTVFGCLAETITLAHRYALGSLDDEVGTRAYIGKPDVAHAKTMMSWLADAGLRPVVIPAH